MQKQLNQVREFMTLMGQIVRDTPQLPSKEEGLLRVALLREEIDELEEALKAGDLIEVADAYTDIQYILNGGILQTGLSNKFEALFDEVQRSNMSKLDENGKPIVNGKNGVLDETKALGKILKSNLYSKPDLKSIIES